MSRVKDYYHDQICGRQWAEDHQREPLDRLYQSGGQDMKTTLSYELHKALVAAVQDIRQELASKEIGGSFRMDIEVTGRVNDGDVMLTYVVGDHYGSNNPKGARLAPVVEEFLRRKGWSDVNKPAALMAPGEFRDEPEAANYTTSNTVAF